MKGPFNYIRVALLGRRFEISMAQPEKSIAEIRRRQPDSSLPRIATATGSSGDVVVSVGDVIAPDVNQELTAFLKLLADNLDYEKVLTAAGFFYLIHYSAREGRIRVLSGFCSLLPLYYTRQGDVLLVSSTMNELGAAGTTRDAVYIAERLLFNYPLTTRTIFENIRRLPAHTALMIGAGEVSEHRFFHVSQLFSANPEPHRRAIGRLRDLFIEEYRRFVPGQPFMLSFTSGFDGRTLLASTHALGRSPSLYSFGAANAADVQLPRQQAGRLGFEYHPVLLDGEVYQDASFSSGKNMVWLSSGEANFARAHYHYAAQLFSKKTQYFITGNFGSELFRALHNVGVMCSSYLYFIFQNDEKAIFDHLSNAPELSLLKESVSRQAIAEAIVEDIRQQDWFNRKDLALNQRFYLFVLEEMFRKYFGAEILMQSNYLTNRAPFLNYRFVKALYQTDLGGPYSDFFEHNKLKRMKGQLFYAHVIDKTFPELSRLVTGKGYRPADLLSWKGYVNIATSYIKKRLEKKWKWKDMMDPFGVEKAFETNKKKWLPFAGRSSVFDEAELSKDRTTIPANTKFTALSLAYYLEELENYSNSVPATTITQSLNKKG